MRSRLGRRNPPPARRTPTLNLSGRTKVPEQWKAPFPFGYAAAAESVGSVASPLLAGFSFALVGLVLPSPEHFRWPNAALLFLFGAGVLFIAAVQFSFWARQYAITADDIKLWQPDYPPGRMHALQRLHITAFNKWNARMNRSYRWGIMALLIGLTLSLVAPSHIGWGRGLVIAVGVLASLLELLWIASTWFLTGSPTTAYDNQPDQPSANLPFAWVRRRRSLRYVARCFVPLTRIQLTEEERPRANSP
jgi:hypothetical protein